MYKSYSFKLGEGAIMNDPVNSFYRDFFISLLAVSIDTIAEHTSCASRNSCSFIC